MLKLKRLKYYQSLMLASLFFLSSCSTTNYDYCPAYPVAGEKVANEIKDLEGEYFWDWVGRINKLRQQLELCKKRSFN